MNRLQKFSIALGVTGMLFLSSCSDYVGKEKSHPLFTKGTTCKTNKNYVDSVKAFEEFLAICPKSATTHRELADIYGDYLGDYNRAIYHYEKYSELGKLNNTDRQDIRKLINSNKRKFYEKYQQENGLTPFRPEDAQPVLDPIKMVALKSELSALRAKAQEILESRRALAAENQTLKEKLAAKSTVTAPTPAPVRTPATPQASSTSGDTYVVKPGDTLMKIAKKVYGSGSHYKLILEANREQVGDKGIVKIGQTLRIPHLPVN